MTCNGRALPLHRPASAGEYVAGVRFRAWQPPHCLHPTIGVHAPLVFDIVDRWNGRSVGGCTYHVMHPGGRNFEMFPVNEFEAEGRRLARFEPIGHTPGPMQSAARARNPSSRIRWTCGATVDVIRLRSEGARRKVPPRQRLLD